MLVAVIADNMSFFMDSFYKLRIGSNKVTDNKEGCFGVMGFQCIKDLACISIFITTIKSQIDFLFIGVCCVVGIIFFQLVAFAVGRVPSFWNPRPQFSTASDDAAVSVDEEGREKREARYLPEKKE